MRKCRRVYHAVQICVLLFSAVVGGFNVPRNGETRFKYQPYLEKTIGENVTEEANEQLENCSDRSIDHFPTDLFTYQQRRHGALLLHAFLAFYCFVLTALVCHHYLLPSLSRICVAMNIRTDVAGATFLALASAFPEMFVNVIGTFLTESDLGVGTVVGSAVFDTFATPACGALITFHAIPLEWQVLSRDCIVYVISVGILVIIMWDGRIAWYEATILLVLLIVYMVLLFSYKFIAACCRQICFGKDSGSMTKFSDNDGNSQLSSSYYKSYSRSDSVADSKEGSTVDYLGSEIGITNSRSSRKDWEELEEYEKPENLFAWPVERSPVSISWFLLVWPLKFLLFATIPDTRRDRFKHWYALTFIMCMVWIAISSYLVSWMVTAVGDIIGIPDSTMGITFLAAGGNMPEVASIFILARQGDGNMAMSNTLGANIMDILLCLGLPWTIKCLMTGKDVSIVSGALSYSVLSIVICIVILYLVLASFKFHLNKKVGVICLLLYTIFLIFAILVELNVFFPVNLPMCDY